MAKRKGGYVAPKPQGPKAITYIGIFPKVLVPAANMWVERGETVMMPGDLVDSLLEQPANWAPGGAPSQADEPAPVDEDKADEPDPEVEGPEEETE